MVRLQKQTKQLAYEMSRSKKVITIEISFDIFNKGKKIAFNINEISTVEDLALIENCIMQSITVNTDTKISLINKLKTKFKNPLGLHV